MVPTPRAVSSADLGYHNGPVMHSNRTHVIFWNPSGASLSWDSGYQSLIGAFLTNVAADSHEATNVYALTGQYADTTGQHAVYDSTFAGALQDTDPAPARPASDCTLPPTAPPNWTICLNKTALETEIGSFVTQHGLPTGLGDLYLLVTPEGFGSCMAAGPDWCSLGGNNADGFCGFHSWFGSPDNPTLYADIPYNAEPYHCQSGNPSPNSNAADLAINTISHEHNESITDPLLSAWFGANGMEMADLCVSNYGPPLEGSSGASASDQVIGTGHYWVQEEWSNDDSGCEAQDEVDAVDFVSPTIALRGVPVSLSGTGEDPDGSIVSYNWDFGDGLAASGPNTSHTFTAAGRFPVTLTISDIDGQRESVTKPIVVSDLPAVAFTFAPASPVPRQSISFRSIGIDPAGSIVSYSWNYGDDSSARSGLNTQHAYAAPGTYTVTLTVTDSAGVPASASRRVEVYEPPTAVLAVRSAHPTAGVPVSLSGASSRASRGALVSYAWSFGDGSSASRVSPVHTFTKPGKYTVRLTVTDTAGRSASTSKLLRIAPAPRIVKVWSHSSTRRASLFVRVNGPGTVRIGTRHKTLARAGTATFKINRRQSASVKLRVAFVPRAGGTITRTFWLRFLT
jgi:PKD repeat protein